MLIPAVSPFDFSPRYECQRYPVMFLRFYSFVFQRYVAETAIYSCPQFKTWRKTWIRGQDTCQLSSIYRTMLQSARRGRC